jgi:opacity protein-like surface antigen
MKKCYLLLATLLLPFRVLAEGLPEGLYANLGLGGVRTDYKLPHQVGIDLLGNFMLIESEGNAPDISGLVGGVGLGYAFPITTRWVLNVETQIDIQHGKISDVDLLSDLFSGLVIFYNTESTLSYTASALLKPGYFLTPGMEIYALAGARFGHFKTSTHSSFLDPPNFPVLIVSDEEQSYSRFKGGLLFGFGVQRAINECFSFDAQYNYADYGRVFSSGDLSAPVFQTSDGLPQVLGTTFNHTHVDAKTQSVMFKLVYHFN